MERLTQKTEAGYAYTGNTSVLLERLGKFEDLWEYVTTDQETLPGQLETLRAANKTKSYQFRELMGRKLNNTYVLGLFQQFKLK
ncbi:MAG: hypothetical protein EOM52_11625 [Clostridia bacterium]|nr:hypothetical protein [Clostridia bacterium]